VFRAEFLCPRVLELADCVTDHRDQGDPPWGENDALGAPVFGILLPFEVAEALEPAEEIVERGEAAPAPRVWRVAEHGLRSAIIVPVAELAGIVDRWRERTCAYKPSAGIPPHITLLFPFVPVEEIDDALIAELSECLQRFASFAFEFRELRRFPATLYLAPEPPEPFAAMTAALVARYRAYKPYGGEFETVVPHLTVAEGDSNLMDEVRTTIEPALPISADCLEAVLLEETERPAGHWIIRAHLPLRSGRLREN